ncbi:Histone-lysine N-methyltransferase [Bertholletia excelsa]
MEVLPCSGVCYVGESDCPQQGSGTTFMFNGESKCLEHGEQVKVAEDKANNSVLNVEVNVEETPQERQGEAKLAANDLLNSEGHCHGASYFEFEVEGQKISCDSSDSEDEKLNGQDICTESVLASETSHLIVDTIDSGVPSNNKEAESSPLEQKWLEHDEPLAVWVKWRGIWQAGIRCARLDWPLSTLKAKPTHDRKKYLVIFFPRTRNYSWADVLLVRPINEFPEPIAYKTHKIGMKVVKDLNLARRFIMQKLAVGMINIVDQLRTQAFIETARNVMALKEFAMEASSCKGYSDLGRMLLKLQSMILQCYLKSDWLQHSFESWAQNCRNANSAESVELLREELVDSIMWEEINLLSDEVMQPGMISEWKNWKHEVMKLFLTSFPSASGGHIVQQTNDGHLSTGLPVSRKRPKLEVRRAESHVYQFDNHDSHQALSVEIDADFFDGQGSGSTGALEQELPREEIQLERTACKESDRWGELLVEARNSEVIQNKDVEETPMSGKVARKPLDPGNKNRQCIAFIEAKGRQCVRWANDGDVYCCVHLASRFVGNTVKAEATPAVETPMCEGTTTLGTKCKHRSLYGSSFCKKHRPRNDTSVPLTSPDNKLKRKHEEIANKLETSNCKDIVLVGELETPLQVDSISVMDTGASNERTLIEMPAFSGRECDDTDTLHCIGSGHQDGSGPCMESPKKLSLYCEKHLPSWLKRARNGKSRIISKEVFVDLLKDCYSREQKLHLHQACELFYRLFKSILSLRNPVPKEIQLQWAISEASKDICVGEFLMKLVRCEIDRLSRLWGFVGEKDAQLSSHVEESGLVPVAVPVPVSVAVPVPVAATDSEHETHDVIKCKICSKKFLDEQALGAHWMDNHKKEAQWLFRGYVCAICFDSFTNKKVLEAHVQERHHVQFVEQCMLFQCIPCGGHFGNPEQLWVHVLAVHPANFRLSKVAEHNNLSAVEDSVQKVEPCDPASIDNKTSASQGGIRKFICRFCGLKFDLLPDLGRHHQAAHMGANSVGHRSQKRGIRFYAYRLKSGRRGRPRFKKGLGSAAYRLRNRGNVSIKNCMQISNVTGTEETEMQSHVAEAGSLGSLAEFQCSTVANILFSEIQETKPRPSNLDILSIARSACCKTSLQATLEGKYGLLPERLYLKAAKLCSEQNILVDWHKEGYICPKGCRPVTKPDLVSSLTPLSENVVGSRSTVPIDAVNNEWEMDECHCVIGPQHFKQSSIQKTFILCDDISFGQESVPIMCVVDEDLLDFLNIVWESSGGQMAANSMPWESFTYVRKPLLGRFISLEPETMQLGCACTQLSCSPETCDHVYLFDNDYEDAKDIFGKPMHGRFPYDEKGQIILEEGYLVYECNKTCSCSGSCQNRVLQNGVQVKLEVFRTEKKGWAVRAREAILRGTFICEYIGEVIDEQEASKRRDRYGAEGWGYFYDIDAHINDMSRLVEGQVPYVIDSMHYGNVSRYINHSCLPNLVNHQVLVESMDCQLAHIGLYAKRDIEAGEELTYDYRYKLHPGEGCRCHCKSANCKGRLY